MSAPGYRGRYAPSPTGVLHLGNARTALLGWLDARAHGGAYVMRVEDIDTPRCIPGMDARQLADLRWLGLDWDEGPDVGGGFGPYRQSERRSIYEDALRTLLERGQAYRCVCSRKDLVRLASAPHAGEEGPAYPGTCRGRFSSDAEARAAVGRAPAFRFVVGSGVVGFTDRVLGHQQQDVEHEVGDVVVKRADGLFAYQLAVVVDDALMGVTHVVRAEDLAMSTPRQMLLAHALGYSVPRYAHVPLLHGPDGQRLQKRTPAHTLEGLRNAGVGAQAVVGWLAHSAGIMDRPEPIRPGELIAQFRMSAVCSRPDWATWTPTP